MVAEPRGVRQVDLAKRGQDAGSLLRAGAFHGDHTGAVTDRGDQWGGRVQSRAHLLAIRVQGDNPSTCYQAQQLLGCKENSRVSVLTGKY